MKKIIISLLLVVSTTGYSKDIEVSITNFKFKPSEVTASVGDTIVFTNEDSSVHNVVPASDSEVKFEKSKTLQQGQSFSLDVTENKAIEAECGIHRSMPGISIHVSSRAEGLVEKIEVLLSELKKEIKEIAVSDSNL